MTVVFIRRGVNLGAGGGSDATPAAINWDNIATSGAVGYASNSAKTVTGIDKVVTFRAAWTSTGTVAKGRWIKNGIEFSDYGLTPQDVNVSVNDQLAFQMDVSYAHPSGAYSTGTVTVTNLTDGGAGIDTFTHTLQYVPRGSGITP